MEFEFVTNGRTLCDNPKYPDAIIHYDLLGPSGNAVYILGQADRALKGAGASPTEIDRFKTQAKSGDYNDLRATVAMWVTAVEINYEGYDNDGEWDDDEEYDY